MTNAAIDYRTASGASRRQDAESVLDKYIRVARVEAVHLSQTYPLPIARPTISANLSFSDYGLLLDVLDELFVLEAAARYADRKSGDIARRRLYNALSISVGYSPGQIEQLFHSVDRTSVPVLRAVARSVLPDRTVQTVGHGASTSNVVPFPKSKT